MSPELANITAELAVLKSEVATVRSQLTALEERLWRFALATTGGGAVGGLGAGAALAALAMQLLSGGTLAP